MFAVGDFIFSSNEGHIHLLQILRLSENGYLVKDYWENDAINTNESEIRAWVKRIDTESCTNYEFFKNEVLTERDHAELSRFLEIEYGLNNRKNRTAAMPRLVENAIQDENFINALDLLTEWAMLEKYRPEIYLLRETCFRKLGRNTEADYERHVYDTISNNKL